MTAQTADVCLLLEGTYPYVSGGVSAWTHDLIQKQSHLTFHIVSLLPRDFKPEQVYEFPTNVIGHTVVHLQELTAGKPKLDVYSKHICADLKQPLTALNDVASLADFERIYAHIHAYRNDLGRDILLDGMDTWRLLVEMYEEGYMESSFLDYFWSWRAIMGSLYSIILAPLPAARVYHSLSTGYAGLMLARAKLETSCPVVLTEHGIYTNERRIEVASADWLEETASKTLTIDKMRRDLRDLWINTFTNYSRICYEACDRIVTLYEGNQKAQIEDGADPSKMQVIPNGINVQRFGTINREPSAYPVIALIGRVVPIKDIKSFIRSCGLLASYMPEFKAYIMGPTDEDREYFNECVAMITHMGLSKSITFTGKVAIDDYLKQVDVIVLTSISEAQPLVILEAGMAGIPTVATDVGACREMIMGKDSEEPYLGTGGAVVPLSNPRAVADAVYTLLANQEEYRKCSDAIRKRVQQYYNVEDQTKAYHDLYAKCLVSEKVG